MIVHYHREEALRQLLESLPVQGVPYSNVVVCDNGSDARLLHGARGVSKDVRWIALPNPGYAGAVNAGVRQLPCGVTKVVVLTHEVRLTSGVLVALTDELDAEPRVGLVGPRLLNLSTGGVWSVGGRLTWASRPKHKRRYVSEGALPTRQKADWLDGACFAARRDDLKAIGGLRDVFFLYFEDVDLGLRVRHLLAKDVVVLPRVVASQSASGALDQYLAVRNLLWMYSFHRMRMARLLLITESLVRLVVGPVLRPAGALERQARRWRGLKDGWSGPRGKQEAGRAYQ